VRRTPAVVKVLCYRSEGRWFDPSWCQWIFFHSSHYGRGFDSASNKNEYQDYSLGVKCGRCVRLTTLPPSCVVTKSGNLDFLEPSGPLRACNRAALPLPFTFDVCVTVYHWYSNINSQLDATIILLLIFSISWTCFGRQFRPSSGALDCVYSLWYNAPAMLPVGDQDEVESSSTSFLSPAGSIIGALYHKL